MRPTFGKYPVSDRSDLAEGVGPTEMADRTGKTRSAVSGLSWPSREVGERTCCAVRDEKAPELPDNRGFDARGDAGGRCSLGPSLGGAAA